MAPKQKRPRVDGDGRTGVTWRNRFVVEVRLPKTVADVKLQGGSYKTEEEAHVARDFISHLRHKAGEKDRALVGGFNLPGVDAPIFKYEKSPETFEKLESSNPRALALHDGYKTLLARPTNSAVKKFCEAMRKEAIVPAIDLLRSSFTQKFPRPSQSYPPPHAEAVEGETNRTPPPPSSEVRVSPTPGREGGASMVEGSTSFIGASSLKVHMSVNDSPSQILLHMDLPGGIDEEIIAIVKAGAESIQRDLIDKVLEELPPCPIDPETIPHLDPESFPSSDPETNPAWE